MAYHSRHNRNGYTTMHFTPDGSARPGRGVHLNAPRRNPNSYGSWHSHSSPHLLGWLRVFDRRLMAIAVIVLAVVVVLAVRGCASSADDSAAGGTAAEETATAEETVSRMTGTVTLHDQSNWDWSNLGRDDDGRYQYVADDQTVSKFGIDVADHQGDIDWQAVAADGVQFAFIRLGYRTTDTGELSHDQLFNKNFKQAREAGIPVGVYFYSQATTTDEAHEEAQFIIDALNGESLDYPVVLDLESSDPDLASRIESIGQDQATQDAIEFCRTVKDAGYDVMVYGSEADLQLIDFPQLTSAVGDVPVWYAAYSGAPDSTASLSIWQYSSKGSVEGIDAVVDLNLQLVG